MAQHNSYNYINDRSHKLEPINKTCKVKMIINIGRKTISYKLQKPPVLRWHLRVLLLPLELIER